MDKIFFSGTSEDRFYQDVKRILKPLTDDVLAGKPDASQKVIRLMYETLSKIHKSLFKDLSYSREVKKAIKSYLKLNNICHIESIARKRKTDRLTPRRAIACDMHEYLSFLPMQLQADHNNIHRFIEHMDNAIWLLRIIRPDRDWIRILEHRQRQL